MAKEKIDPKKKATAPAKKTVTKKVEKVAEKKVSSKNEKALKKPKQKKEKKPKKPKGRIKVVPLIIVAVLVVGGIVFERFFLDSVLKNVIISVVQSSYGAKCDIDSVDIELYDGSLVIENFALADKASPMQNLFEFSRSSIDFDVTQVFLGRFVADELSVEGVALGTPRETSGELPRIIPESEPKEDTKEGKFALAINDTKSTLTSNTQNVIEQAIATYNPENLMASYLENLQVPGLVESSQNTVEEITDYWQNVAPELEESGEALFASVEEVQALLETETVDVKTITDGVATIQTLVDQGKALQSQVNEVSTRLENDIDTVEGLSSEIQGAIRADTSFVQNEINNITSFTFDDAQGMVSSGFEGFIVGILGDYYPTIQKVLDGLSRAKAVADESSKEEKETFERLRGRTVQFNAEMPSFLVKNVVFSGSDTGNGVSVSGFAHDVSNNPDLIQTPATANLDLAMADFAGTLDALVDLRTVTENFPIELDFKGSGLDTSSLTSSSSVGIPSIGGDANITAEANFELTGDFDLDANFDFNPALLSAASFEPSSVYDMYSSVLEAIQSFYLQTEVSFSLDEGIGIGIDTDVDKKIIDGLSTALNAEIAALKENLQEEAEAYLAGYTDGFMDTVSSFGDVSSSMQDLQGRLGNIDGELESIKGELEQRLKDQAAGAVKEGAQEAASNLLKGFF